jgi:hypothetical protein
MEYHMNRNRVRMPFIEIFVSVLLAAGPVFAQNAGQNSGSSSAQTQPSSSNQNSNSPQAQPPAATPDNSSTQQQPAASQTPEASAPTADGQDQSATSGGQDAASTPSANSSDQSTTDKKYPHDGGIDDVSAIGNRNIGGRGMGNWYSLDKQIAMGKQYAQQIEASVKLVQDPVVTEYINRVGQNLVRNSDAKVPFTIKVIDTDDINAMALPGGFFYVNSGLILAADNEAELAGVMAHEISHVAAQHVAREMTRSNWANIAYLPLIFVGGGIGYGARAAASVLVPAGFMKFSRGFEAQADYLGIEYMYKTGYDPQAFVTMMEKMENLEKKKPGTIAKVFASHPADPDRVKASEKEIASILPPRQEYVLDTSEFEEVKARLAALENKHKVQDQKDNNRPTLRRASVDNPNNNGNSKNDDQRPVLKRRDDPQNQNDPQNPNN